MDKVWKTSILVICLILSTSCRFSEKIENDEEQKKEGEVTLNKFYNFLIHEDYKGASKMFGKEFFTKISEDKLLQTFTDANRHCGKMKSFKITDWRSSKINADEDMTQYSFLLNVQYDQCNTSEQVNIKKNENEETTIIGYWIEMK